MVNVAEVTKPRIHNYTYRETLAASEKIGWRVEDIIGGDKRLDFSKPFMPESLALVEQLSVLNPDQRRVMNQIRGNTYLSLFGVLEEFILPFVVDHARPQLSGDDYRVRAFLQFASEEAKHIQLFKRFREDFERGFGSPCGVIGPPDEIAREILSHSQLGVGLVILQGEWMTQRHYIESIRDNQDLDPQFKSLLRHHWMEEAQHAKLDTLMVESLAERRSREEIESDIDEFLAIVDFLDHGLKEQVELDVDSLELATGLRFTSVQRDEIVRAQHQANRWTYIGSGLTHPRFLATLDAISPNASNRIQQLAPTFC